MRDFFRALSKLQVIATHSDWFIALFTPVVIGRSHCFAIAFPTFENRSITKREILTSFY